MADKYFFVKLAWDVWTVSKKRNVDIGVAYDMLRTDITNGGARKYNTAASLPADYDFVGLKAKFDAMTEDDQVDAYAAWHAFVDAKYAILCEAWNAGDKAAFDAVVAQYVG